MKILLCLEPEAGRASQTAARLARGVAGAQIVWISVGAQPCRLSAFAGAHEQIDVVDPALSTAHPMLAAVAAATLVRREAPDLVLTGVRSDGRGLGLFPAAVAATLNWHFVAQVADIAPAATLAEVLVEAASSRAEVKVPYPAVLACVPQADAGGGAPGDGPRKQLTLADLELDSKGAWRRSTDWFTERVQAPKPTMVRSPAAFWAAMDGKKP